MLLFAHRIIFELFHQLWKVPSQNQCLQSSIFGPKKAFAVLGVCTCIFGA